MGENHNSNPVKSLVGEIQNENLQLFSHSDIMSITSDLETKLDDDGLSIVYKGQLSNGRQVVVKVLKQGQIEDDLKQDLIATLSTVAKIYHRNIVKLFGFCFEDDTTAIVYEFMEKGSLDQILYDNPLSIEWVKFHNIAVETAKGLAYLHEGCEERIFHRDIKPSKVLLDANLRPKVAGFELATLCNWDKDGIVQDGYRGTLGFAAPEVALGWDELTGKCDVFSFGMLLFEILTRKRNMGSKWFPGYVWDMYETRQLDQLIVECGIGSDDTDKAKAKALAIVALWCAQFNPEDRPPMTIVVKMLEGVIEPSEPPNPFPHYVSALSNKENEHNTYTIDGASLS